jgi:hypothetical protein
MCGSCNGGLYSDDVRARRKSTDEAAFILPF